MKVIQDKWSKAQFVYPFRKNCPNCTSELEIEEGDVQPKKGENQWGASYSYFTATCTLCSHVFMVEPQKR